MNIVERSLSSQNKRPRPLVYIDRAAEQAVVMTNWGATETAATAMDTISQYLVTAQADVEVTSPFESILTFSRELNALRHALLICNEQIYRTGNRDVLSQGFEVAAFWKKGSVLSWVRVGAPQIYLRRSGKLSAVSVSVDLETELAQPLTAPLPIHLLGLEPQLYVVCGSTLLQSGDEIFLSSHQFDNLEIESQFFQPLDGESLLNQYGQHLTQKHPSTGAWLGLLTF